ncbi:MAG: VOC family protein [Pseudomonadales bacterium]|nr:VOC family protein [Pseudomonadales bacterium]
MVNLKSVSPQLLVADLNAAIAHYEQCLGFSRKIDYGGFYGSVERDGVEIHLKGADKLPGARAHVLDNDHVDAFIEVEDVKGLYTELQARGASILRAVTRQPWGAEDFYVLDLDGYVLCFSERDSGD